MSQPLPVWAGTTNYPAGAFSWSGTPTKVAPAITFFTPNVPFSAQNMNYLLNQRDAIAAQAILADWATAAANWGGPLNGVGTPAEPPVVSLAACWDAWYQRWIVGGETIDGRAVVNYSADGGRTWSAMTVPTPSTRSTAFAVSARPGSGDLCAIRSDGATTSVSFWGAGAGTGTDTVQAFLAAVDQGIATFFNGAFWFVGATGFTTSTWVGHAGTSSTGSGTWTDESGGLPAGWTSSGAGNTVLEWLTAQSTSLCVFALCGKTPGTDTSRLMTLNTSGVFADITPGVLGGTSQEIRGLAYVANDGLWGLLTQDNSSPDPISILYTSPDLSVWTQVQQFSGYWAGGVSAIGSAWVVLLCDEITQTSGNRVMYSIDVATEGASSSWAFASYAEEIGGAGAQLMASPASVFISNASGPALDIDNGVNGAQNLSGTQILRVQLVSVDGAVATSSIAGFSGFAPIAAVAAPSSISSSDGLGTAAVQSGGIQVTGNGGHQWSSQTVTEAVNYTIDSGNAGFTDGTVVVDTSAGTVALTLPAPTAGRRLRIIDKMNTFATNNCTLVRHAAEKIDNVAGTKTLSTNGYRGWVESDGVDWYSG